jgi:hypothetical protein
MDQASQRIRDKLWYGILPNVAPAKRSGRFGSGRMCDGCDLVLGSKDVEYNVELPDGRTLSFHLNCCRSWSQRFTRRITSGRT